MFFENSFANKRKNKNVVLTKTQLPEPKEVELILPVDIQGQQTAIIDVECYHNYFECGFKFLELERYCFFEIYRDTYSFNGQIVTFEQWQQLLSFCLHRFLTVGFNSGPYDLLMLFAALSGKYCDELKQLSNEIIGENKRSYRTDKLNHIDIIEVAPLSESLKTYAGRIHVPRMQELPYHHEEILDEEQVYYVRGYNVNDLDNTGLLYKELKGQIRLREKLGKRYGLDLRSKSDAQLAEAVIKSELNKIGIKARRPTIGEHSVFRYNVPDFIKFKTPGLQHVLEVVRNAEFTLDGAGHPILPKSIDNLKINLHGKDYTIKIGGLHSKEASASYFATDKLLIVDVDAEAYYPNIILNQQLFPEHLGPGFLVVIKNLIDLRSECKTYAKKYKLEDNNELYIYWDEESGSLKIVNNGTFGKTGDKWSIIFSPQLTIQTTLSGQLQLLMAIEALGEKGFEVISANTDGIVSLVPTERKAEFDQVFKDWGKALNFKTEETHYKALLSANVNSYIAIKGKKEPNSSFFDEQQGCKTKGFYCERGSALNSVLSKNPETYICVMAVINFIVNGVALKDTVENCKDVRRFVSVRKVEGGAQKNGQYLGKVIRWYYAEGEIGTINYVKTGNSVPKSEGAKPLMDLPDEFPNDINYAYYINEATSMLFDIGYYRKQKTGSLF